MTVSPEGSDYTTASDNHGPNPPHKVSFLQGLDSLERKRINIIPIVRRRKRSADRPGRLDHHTSNGEASPFVCLFRFSFRKARNKQRPSPLVGSNWRRKERSDPSGTSHISSGEEDDRPRSLPDSPELLVPYNTGICCSRSESS